MSGQSFQVPGLTAALEDQGCTDFALASLLLNQRAGGFGIANAMRECTWTEHYNGEGGGGALQGERNGFLLIEKNA